MQPISFGAFKSPEDYRAVQLTAVLGAPVDLPEEYFVDIKNLPIWNQRGIGACVGHAGAKYKQKFEEVETKNVISMSPRFLYALAKCNDNYPNEGTYPRLLMQMMQKYGCATEKTCPNDTTLSHEDYVYQRKQENIPKAAFDEAKKYAIKSYANVGLTVDELKQAIVKANGCMLLTRVGREWWSDKEGNVTWDANRILPIQPPKVIVSGHETWLYGYKSVAGITKFYFVNSWTKDWADKGTGYFIFEQYKPFIDEAITAVDLPNNWLEELQQLPPANEFHHGFYYDLKYGQENEEVRMLQIALKIDGEFPKTQAETGFYGPITQKAVRAFQEKYKVASWYELKVVNGKRCGIKTRQQLNKLFKT